MAEEVKTVDHILLIDDDEPTNFLNSIIIKKSGLCPNVHIKYSALEALEWLQDEEQPTPDLIFLDINMPVMSGWEFLEEYGKLPLQMRKKIVLAMLTTSLNPKDEENATHYDSVDFFLNKPLTLDKIKDVVSAM